MESDLVKKLFYKQARIYGTDLHVLEFSPSDFEMVVAEGDQSKKEPLSEIRHNWYEEKGYKRVAAINMQFFWLVSLGLQYLDKGYLNNNGKIDDQFLELIYENKELKIDNIIGPDIKSKYPKAEWAAGVGFQLIKDGKINTRYGKKFDHYNYRHPRTAVGQKANGEIIWLVTDGRTGEDLGLTGEQLAQIMLDLGCVIAISFDGGGSSEMVIGDEIINELRFGYERPICSALLLYAKQWRVEKGGNEMLDISKLFKTVRYGHLDEIYVHEGQMINTNLDFGGGVTKDATSIGKMGNTGKSYGAHLHIDVVDGIRKENWRLSKPGTFIPNKIELNFFVDKSLFGVDPVITIGYMDKDYKKDFGIDHKAYDVVPCDRHSTTKHFIINWNRSSKGRVMKVGYDPAYGNYVLITYCTLNKDVLLSLI